jgi:hypothetical protein
MLSVEILALQLRNFLDQVTPIEVGLHPIEIVNYLEHSCLPKRFYSMDSIECIQSELRDEGSSYESKQLSGIKHSEAIMIRRVCQCQHAKMLDQTPLLIASIHFMTSIFHNARGITQSHPG